MIIDSHLHVWDLDRSPYSWIDRNAPPFNRTFTFDEVAPQLAENGVDAVILVQADDDDRDTDLMLEVAAERPEVVGVVAYIPLERPAEAAARLEVLQANPYVVGIRNLTHDRLDPDWVLRPDVDETLGLIEQAIPQRAFIHLLSLRHADLAIIEATISEDSPVAHMSIDEIDLPVSCVIAAIARRADLIVPDGQTVIEPFDEIIAVTHRNEEDELRRLLTLD